MGWWGYDGVLWCGWCVWCVMVGVGMWFVGRVGWGGFVVGGEVWGVGWGGWGGGGGGVSPNSCIVVMGDARFFVG